MPIDPLGQGNPQDYGCKPAGALSQNAGQAQQADVSLLIAQQLHSVAEAIDGDTKQELGHDREAQQVNRAAVELAES